MKDISQDRASALCGYSRPTIGHIENGRIAVDKSRILHIISSYGFKYHDFERYLQVDNLRDEIIDHSMEKLKTLSDEKLGLIWGIIDSMGEKKSVS
jgi:transcriptional regulator with XRE-family HTH domain